MKNLSFFCFIPLVLNLLIDSVSGQQQLQCIACGLPKVSPDRDVYGSYGPGFGQKRYNHSCAEYEEGEPARASFLRTCPAGVQSCFFVTGVYKDMTIRYRGCAEAKYEHDYGCDRELQAVNVLDQRGRLVQVDVDVTLCYCNNRDCNHEMSGGLRPYSAIWTDAKSLAVILAIFMFTYL